MSAFVMVGTVWSVCSLRFFVLIVPPHAQPFIKVGARAPMPYKVGATDKERERELPTEWKKDA